MDLYNYTRSAIGGDVIMASSEITKEEVQKAIKPDQIHAETLKLIAEANSNGLNLLFNSIYKARKNPTNRLKSTFVTLTKKTKSLTV